MIQAFEVRFKARASAHVSDSYAFYEAEQEGLGLRFLQAMDKAVERISRFPDSCPVFHRDTRRIPLIRFPYSLYFRAFNGRVNVVAVLHAKREPSLHRSYSD